MAATVIEEKFLRTFAELWGPTEIRNSTYTSFLEKEIAGKKTIANEKIIYGDKYRTFFTFDTPYAISTSKIIESNRGRVIHPKIAYKKHEYILSMFPSSKDANNFLTSLKGYEVYNKEMHHLRTWEDIIIPLQFMAVPFFTDLNPELDCRPLLDERELKILRTAIDENFYKVGGITREKLADQAKKLGVAKGPKGYTFSTQFFDPAQEKAVEIALQFHRWLNHNPVLKSLCDSVKNGTR